MNEEIMIDRDVFDEIYDARNPLPDRQDYEALEKHYKNKGYVFREIQKAMNTRYREKFYQYLERFDKIALDRVTKDDEWTDVKLGEKTRGELETLYGEYRERARGQRQEIAYGNVNEYLKQWILRLVYNDLLSNQDFPDGPLTAPSVDGPEAPPDRMSEVVEASLNSGEPAVLPVQRSTRGLLDRLREMTFLETYDQVVIYLLGRIRSRKYGSYLAAMEKTDGKPGGPAAKEKMLPEEAVKIRDAEDFIIDYIHLLKIKKTSNNT